jgi:hypothetical protein
MLKPAVLDILVEANGENILNLSSLHAEVVSAVIKVIEEEAAEVSQQVLIDHIVTKGWTVQLLQLKVQAESRGRRGVLTM